MTRQPAPQTSEHHRRTQSERRAETVELLLDATIATIAELGYHRATTAEICARAGVTQGALFHHFKARVDLVLAALQQMTEQRIARYVEFAEGIRAGSGDPLDLLRMVGLLARDDVAAVWAEITVAARTDPELRERVAQAIETRWALIRAAAGTFPGLAVMEPLERDVWLQLLRGTIEFSPLIEPLQPDGDGEELDERRNRALLALAGHLGARFPAS
jgi:AcrR family transcriptional regulator